MFCPFEIKNYIITGLDSNFFNAPCNRVTSSLQKRNQHKLKLNFQTIVMMFQISVTLIKRMKPEAEEIVSHLFLLLQNVGTCSWNCHKYLKRNPFFFFFLNLKLTISSFACQPIVIFTKSDKGNNNNNNMLYSILRTIKKNCNKNVLPIQKGIKKTKHIHTPEFLMQRNGSKILTHCLCVALSLF